MSLFKPRGMAGSGGWELPQYSYLSPVKLGPGLSLAICNKQDEFDLIRLFCKEWSIEEIRWYTLILQHLIHFIVFYMNYAKQNGCFPLFIYINHMLTKFLCLLQFRNIQIIIKDIRVSVLVLASCTTGGSGGTVAAVVAGNWKPATK